jgi:PhnB protein
MFWGDRMAALRDPFGHEWVIATHVEEVTPEEIHRRASTAV